jgi:hypothetical protein
VSHAKARSARRKTILNTKATKFLTAKNAKSTKKKLVGAGFKPALLFVSHAKARSHEERTPLPPLAGEGWDGGRYQASELRHSRESGNPVLPKHQTSKSLLRQKRTFFIFSKTSFLDSRFRGNDGAQEVFFFAASHLRVRRFFWIASSLSLLAMTPIFFFTLFAFFAVKSFRGFRVFRG